MPEFLSLLETHYAGVFVLALITLIVIFFVNWILWMFSWGRFKNEANKTSPNGSFFYAFVDLMVKIINDFRHFLALVLVLIFAVSLMYAFYFTKTVNEMSDALQAVMSTLGTLVGSIVGYYFGESAVRKANEERSKTNEIPIQEQLIREVEPPIEIR